MAKFFGVVGFNDGTVETSPGVWEPVIVEKQYYGDIIRNNRRIIGANQVNDNLTVTNEISIISDPYANLNFHSIVYVEFMGSKWKVTNIEVQFPRLMLTLGGVWNEQTN